MTQRDRTAAAISARIDELYALPLPSFIPGRNALAAALKREGHGAEAERVRQLPRPALSAWTVNQLYWHERARFEALITAGEGFRRVQQEQLAGRAADVVPALDARREAVAALTRAAARLLHASGHSPTVDMMRRVTSTLEALASYGRGDGGPAHGRLVADVAPPGFEALAALVPRVGGQTVAGHGTRRVLAFGERDNPKKPRGRTTAADELQRRDLVARRSEANLGLKQAERERERARRAARKARGLMKAAAARAAAAERAAAVAAAVSEKSASLADTARRAARKTAADAETAVQILQEAEVAAHRAREKARAIPPSKRR